MMRRRKLDISFLIGVFCFLQGTWIFGINSQPQLVDTIHWETWSPSIFERAKKENRFVLLDLEAVWCHWCHVMDEKTYHDPKVIKLIRSRYLPVRVDQDSRPDLSNRYEDYGWPATIVFNVDGNEIVKRQGYLSPDEMVPLLEAIIHDPSPGPSARPPIKINPSHDPFLTSALREELLKKHISGYDPKEGGWGTTHKFLDWDSVEYCLMRALDGDKQSESMAKQTLLAQLKLMDPVWGGVYQYSTNGDWEHPHFEKIMSMQAENMRIYALAYALWKDSIYLQAARDIHRYLITFLISSEGAFFTSQDADLRPGEHSAGYFKLNDAGRRKLGIPRVDQHIYSRENGWVIQALTTFYSVTGEEFYLEEAKQAARWMLAHRILEGGGFRHDTIDSGGPYFNDTLSMGRAFLGLYAATADRSWLKHAQESAAFIGKHFMGMSESHRSVGFVTADFSSSNFNRPEPQLDENIAMARFANLLFHYSGDKPDRQFAECAMRYLATPEIARKPFLVAGILLADMELEKDPTHITVVGSKNDLQAKRLFITALKHVSSYKRTEWWDPREAQLPNTDFPYPQFKKAAAFTCTAGRCSSPIFEPEEILKEVGLMRR